MPAAHYDLLCEQGADFKEVFYLDNEDGPLDLTDFSSRMHVRYRMRATETLVELNEGYALGTGIVTDPSGYLDVRISSTDTGAMPKSGVYDIELIDAAGDVHRILQGEFILDKEVTR